MSMFSNVRYCCPVNIPAIMNRCVVIGQVCSFAYRAPPVVLPSAVPVASPSSVPVAPLSPVPVVPLSPVFACLFFDGRLWRSRC